MAKSIGTLQSKTKYLNKYFSELELRYGAPCRMRFYMMHLWMFSKTVKDLGIELDLLVLLYFNHKGTSSVSTE